MTGYGNIKKQDRKYSKVNRNKVILDFAGWPGPKWLVLSNIKKLLASFDIDRIFISY